MQITSSKVHGIGMNFNDDIKQGSVFFREMAFSSSVRLEDLVADLESRVTVQEMRKFGMILGNTIQKITERYVHRLGSTAGSYGFGLFKQVGLINNSCAPNAAQFFNSDGSCWLVATRDCRTGEEIFIPYSTNISAMPVVNRRMTLKNRLEFWCECSRCVREDAALPFEQQPQYNLPIVQTLVGDKRYKAVEIFVTCTEQPTWIFDLPPCDLLTIMLRVYQLRSVLRRHAIGSHSYTLLLCMITEVVGKICRLVISRFPNLLDKCRDIAAILQEVIQPPYRLLECQGGNNVHLLSSIYMVSCLCLRTQNFPDCFLWRWAKEQKIKYQEHFELLVRAEGQNSPFILRILD